VNKYYYTMGEVCNLLGLKPHVIRYWETEFVQLRQKREDNRNRRYTIKDINLIKKIMDLLYNQKYTIEGVRKKLHSEDKKIDDKTLSFTEQKILRKEIVVELLKIKEILTALKGGK